MNERLPDPLPVGQILAAELEARDWTQSDFAAVVDRPVQFVSEIVTGRKEITRDSAAQIGAALGHTPEYWLSLQDQYLLNKQANNVKTQQNLTDVRRRARLNDLAPISVLRKRGVLQGRTIGELEAEVVDLLDLADINEQPTFRVAARRSNHMEPSTPLQQAWVGCVRREARVRAEGVSRYSQPKLEALASELPTMLTSPAAFGKLPERFADVGVVLIYVEAIPSAKIDGCAFMLEGAPVIAVSGRGKRLDKVLWTLLHEVAHVRLGHASAEIVVESLYDHHESEAGEEPDGDEIAANETAGAWLLPNELPNPMGRVSASWVETVASQLRLAPIVIVGQLQARGILDWRTTLARNAPTVTDILEIW